MMDAIFSSNELSALERDVDLKTDRLDLKKIWGSNELNRCIKWIKENDFNKICLQFSDELLCHSNRIAGELKKHVESNVYILADTSYGSCCVDEIAASHVASDCVIHFGHACLSKITRLPVLYIFTKSDVDVDQFVADFKRSIPDKSEKVSIFYDVSCFHSIDVIANQLKHYINLEIGKLAQDGVDPDILCWSLKNDQNTENSMCVYLGLDNQSFFNISMTMKCRKWFLFDTEESKLKDIQSQDTKWLKKRYFYIEKCKDAQQLGIVVGTLSTKGYLDMVKHIQELALKRKVKTYIFSVGKVNPAKLANFTDIDCFVLIGCPENNLYHSKDFYKPLVSIFEIEMALNPAWHSQIPDSFCTDFREVLPEGRLYKASNDIDTALFDNDMSLVTGKVRNLRNQEETTLEDGTMAERSSGHLQELSSASKFQERTFRGLDPALGKNEAAKIEQGRRGIAIKYEENPMDF